MPISKKEAIPSNQGNQTERKPLPNPNNKINKLDILASEKFNQCYNNIFGSDHQVVKSLIQTNIKNEKIKKGLKEQELLRQKTRLLILGGNKEIQNNRAKSLYFKNKLQRNFSQKYLDNFVYKF